MSNLTKHAEKSTNNANRSTSRESTLKNCTNKCVENLELKLSGQPVNLTRRGETRGGRARAVPRRPMSALPSCHSRSETLHKKGTVPWRRPQSAQQSLQSNIASYKFNTGDNLHISHQTLNSKHKVEEPTSSSLTDTDECDRSETTPIDTTPSSKGGNEVNSQTSSSLSSYSDSKLFLEDCDGTSVIPSPNERTWTDDELTHYCNQAERNFVSPESMLSDECDPSEKSLGEKISSMAREQLSVKFLLDANETLVTKPPLPSKKNTLTNSMKLSKSYPHSRLQNAEQTTDLLLQQLANQDLNIDYSDFNYESYFKYFETPIEQLQSTRSKPKESFKLQCNLSSPLNEGQEVDNYVCDNLNTPQKVQFALDDESYSGTNIHYSLTEHIQGTSEGNKTGDPNSTAIILSPERQVSRSEPKYIRAKERPTTSSVVHDIGNAGSSRSEIVEQDLITLSGYESDLSGATNSYNFLKSCKNQQISPHCDNTHRKSFREVGDISLVDKSKSTDFLKGSLQIPFSPSSFEDRVHKSLVDPYMICEKSCLTNSSRSSLPSSFKPLTHHLTQELNQSEVDTNSSHSKLFCKLPNRSLYRSRSVEPLYQSKPLTASRKSYSFLTLQLDSSEAINTQCFLSDEEDSKPSCTPSRTRQFKKPANWWINDQSSLTLPSKKSNNIDNSLFLQSSQHVEQQSEVNSKCIQNDHSGEKSNFHNVELTTNLESGSFNDLQESNNNVCCSISANTKHFAPASETVLSNDPTSRFKNTFEQHVVPEMPIHMTSSKPTLLPSSVISATSVSVEDLQKTEENHKNVSFMGISSTPSADGRDNTKDLSHTVNKSGTSNYSVTVTDIFTEKFSQNTDVDISDDRQTGSRTCKENQHSLAVSDDKFMMVDSDSDLLFGAFVEADLKSLHSEALDKTQNSSSTVREVKTAYDDIINILEVLEGEDPSSFSCLDTLLNDKADLKFTSNTQSYQLFASEDSATNLAEIFSYLDKIDRKTLSALSSTEHVRPSLQDRGDGAALCPNVGEISQMRLEDLLKLNVVELAHMVYTLNFQAEDKAKSIRLLKNTLAQERKRNETLIKDSEKNMNSRLKEQKEQYESTIARHQTFIDQLISDKKSLTNKVESVVLEMKSLEERHVKNIKTLEERHTVEIQRAKEMQAANNKLRMDRMLDTKTKKIKEQTVKGLEPELARMMASHAQEISELRQLHQHELHEMELRAARKTEQAMEQLRQQLHHENYEIMAKERDSLKLRVEKAVEQEEMLFQEHRQRLLNETKREKKRLEEELNETKRDHAKVIAHMRQEHQDSLECMKKRHEADLRNLREEAEGEREVWQHSYKKQKEADFHSREQELWEELKKERDRQIDLAVATLSEESENAKKNVVVGMEKKIKKLTEKYEVEMRELEASEQTVRAKYREIKSQLITQDDTITELKASVRQLEMELGEERKISASFSAERAHVKEAIRQEFLGKVTSLEQELSRVRSELATSRSKFEVELGTLKTIKEREMQAVYNRVKTTVAQRDLTIEELSGKCRQLQELLEAQRKEFLLK